MTPVHPTLQAAQVAPLELLLQVQTLGAEQRPPFKQGGVQVAIEQVQVNSKHTRSHEHLMVEAKDVDFLFMVGFGIFTFTTLFNCLDKLQVCKTSY